MSKRVRADLGLGHIRVEVPRLASLPATAREYGEPAGDRQLREAVARWEGVSCDQIALTTGASLGLVSTLSALAAGGSVLCPRPYYPLYPKMMDALRIQPILYDVGRDGCWAACAGDMQALARTDTRALLVNVPGNPTGCVPDADALQALAEVARTNGWFVISDEAYGHFLYTGKAFPPVSEVFASSSLVRIRSFSKLFCMPGERLGYVITTPDLRALITERHWQLAMSPPASAQRLALSVFAAGADGFVSGILSAVARNRKRAEHILSSCPGITFSSPAGGIFSWIRVDRCPLESRRLAQACAEQSGVVVVPGAAFGITDTSYLRASFAVPVEELEEGFTALSECIAALARRCSDGT